MVGEHKPTPRDNQRKERVATIALCFIRGRTRVQREEDRSPCTNHAHAESHRGLPRNTRVRYASFTRVKETAGSASRTLPSLVPACLDHDNLSLSVMLMKGVPFPKRGLAEATPRTQKVLAQEQSEAHGDSKQYNILLKSQQGST